ncbi:hypothetical protein [Sinimarinibacterium thermocellulolyticum]|uniref:Flagellar hook-length control protein FliK n=1 Tax=Sinimarinibacterium thermocellulolyticum TaxID=3170016 RepID=A0ABV2A631_9GAMM
MSLLTQLHDGAVPEAVRADADAPLLRSAPAASASAVSEAESFETPSAESVADMAAPAAPPPARAPAKPAAEPAPQREADAAPLREEQLAGAAKRQAAERRERAAQAEALTDAPQAQAFAFASAAEATLDAVSIAARELLRLLQAQDPGALAARAPKATQLQIESALPAFAAAHSAQILPRSSDAAIWRVAFADERGRMLGHATLSMEASPWQLLALEASSSTER